jgi:hypothetical protein
MPRRRHRRFYTLPPRRAAELRFVAIKLESGRQRSVNRGLNEILVVSQQKTKYNIPMNRGAYSYWFRFWYPPI